MQKTGVSKVAYVGHSQGTSQMYAALATQHDWFKERVSIFVSLGSVTRLDHMTSDLLKLLITTDIAIPTIKALGIVEMFPSDYLTKPTFILLCGTLPWVCKFGSALVADADPRVDDTLYARNYFGHFPSGSSLKCLEHYAQIYKAKKFQGFDNSASLNLDSLNDAAAAQFDLTHVTVPIAHFTGNSDCLGDVTDNHWLSDQIRNTMVLDKIYDYGHLSFFIAKDMVWMNDMRDVLNIYHPANQMQEPYEVVSTTTQELIK